jgi:predicted DCC family thiol-disulfide oxidoreductase YuxK
MDATPEHARGVMIFDGDCGFCTTAIDWFTRVLPAPPATVPYQWADLAEYGLTESDTRERVWLVTAARQYGGHVAFAAVLRHQPTAGFRLLGALADIPPVSMIARVAYALVARYRHRLPGGTPACRMKP